MVKRWVLGWVLGALLGGGLQAQEAPQAYWNDTMIQVTYSDLGLQFKSGSVVSPFPLLKPELRTLLERFPDSRASLHDFDAHYGGGQGLLWTGVAVAVGGVILGVSQTSNANPQPIVVGAALTLALGGLGVELWGAGTILDSYHDLFTGVNQYNVEQFQAYAQTHPGVGN